MEVQNSIRVSQEGVYETINNCSLPKVTWRKLKSAYLAYTNSAFSFQVGFTIPKPNAIDFDGINPWICQEYDVWPPLTYTRPLHFGGISLVTVAFWNVDNVPVRDLEEATIFDKSTWDKPRFPYQCWSFKTHSAAATLNRGIGMMTRGLWSHCCLFCHIIFVEDCRRFARESKWLWKKYKETQTFFQNRW